MVLTTLSKKVAPSEARNLLERSQQESPETSGVILEMVTSIMVYKFEQLSRKDIDTMLGITLKGTRVYEEAKEEGREEEAANLIILQLKTRFGQELSEEICARIGGLPLSTLRNLGQALFNFTSLDDLQAWLDAQ